MPIAKPSSTPSPTPKTGSKSKTTVFADQPRVALAGSEKSAYVPTSEPDTTITLNAAAGKASRKGFTVSVVLQPRSPVDPSRRLTRAQFAKLHSPTPTSLKLLTAFADEYGLTYTLPTPGRRTVHLSGTQPAFEDAFGTKLEQSGGFRVRKGALTIPESLAGHIEAVLGLDDRPQATAQSRVAAPRASNTSYTPVQVAALYGIPTNLTANGQTIALIELGGGFRTADLKAYFKSLSRATPAVTAVLVDGAKNAPSTASGADGEVMLDIEVAAALAPGAKIAVYFAPNTDQGFIDAIATAVHDTTHNPSVISISWGGPESTWTQQSISALDQACQTAAALGITITVACGDNGYTDGVAGTTPHVDFPASSPHVLACGGTKLTASGTQILAEVVWNELTANEGATGGGVSNVFPLPTWQAKSGVPKSSSTSGGRGLPDVSGNADPATGYTIRVDGQTAVIGGTSAVAPLWAGIIALSNAQSKTTAGFLNPVLYAANQTAYFRDITSGTNGKYPAGKGWDASSGLGSPLGPAILNLIAPTKTTSRK